MSAKPHSTVVYPASKKAVHHRHISRMSDRSPFSCYQSQIAHVAAVLYIQGCGSRCTFSRLASPELCTYTPGPQFKTSKGKESLRRMATPRGLAEFRWGWRNVRTNALAGVQRLKVSRAQQMQQPVLHMQSWHVCSHHTACSACSACSYIGYIGYQQPCIA